MTNEYPQTTRPTGPRATPIDGASAGSEPPAPAIVDPASIHDPLGRDQTSPPAKHPPQPIGAPRAGSQTAQPTMIASTAKQDTSAEPNVPGDQLSLDVEENNQPTAMAHPAPSAVSPSAASHPQTASPDSTSKGDAPSGGVLHAAHAAIEADPVFLSLLADIVDDLEAVRIANRNRFDQLTRSEPDKDGIMRGLGLDLMNPYVQRVAEVLAEIESAEKRSVKALEALMRKHPLGAWVKSQRGLGEKQVARLLGVIGDPYVRPAMTFEDGTVEPARARTVSELWAYCGYHVLPARHPMNDAHRIVAGGSKTGHPDQELPDNQNMSVGVAPKRQRGQRANWSTTAKTRAFLVAESCIKTLRKPCQVDKDLGYAPHADGCACSPFRVVYDQAKAKCSDTVHQVPCVRCGPSGQPAEAGSPLSAAHKNARAMRITSKEILKELWRASKALHDAAGDAR